MRSRHCSYLPGACGLKAASSQLSFKLLSVCLFDAFSLVYSEIKQSDSCKIQSNSSKAKSATPLLINGFDKVKLLVKNGKVNKKNKPAHEWNDSTHAMLQPVWPMHVSSTSFTFAT